MSSLSASIETAKRLKNAFYDLCSKRKIFIKDLISHEPNIAFKGHKTFRGSSVSIRSWNDENFFLFDEVKGVNIFIIHQLNDYLKEINSINSAIEVCYKDLKDALKSYDSHSFTFEPMSDEARDMFEQDRWSILRPLKDLDGLKSDIISDAAYIEWINAELRERNKRMNEYKNYNINDLNVKLDDLLRSIRDIDI